MLVILTVRDLTDLGHDYVPCVSECLAHSRLLHEYLLN